MNAVIRRDARCRYCDKQLREHQEADHAFAPRRKRPSVSNSFSKTHISALLQLCESALTGQPLTKSFLRSKPFVDTYNKIVKMQKRVLQLEQEKRLGENKE